MNDFFFFLFQGKSSAELIMSIQKSFFGDLSLQGEWHPALLSAQSLSSYQESISI